MTIDRETLKEQHAALEQSASALGALIAADAPDMEQLGRVKWQLGYRLAIHLAHEDQHVYPALKAHSDARIAKLALLYEREMGDLDQRFRVYIAAWSADRIIADWLGFRRETGTILDLLSQRIGREERELYPLV